MHVTEKGFKPIIFNVMTKLKGKVTNEAGKNDIKFHQTKNSNEQTI